MTRGKHNAVKAGSVQVGDRPPYGYRVVKVGSLYTLEIVEAEAEIIRLIFSWYVDEGLPLRAIAARLTSMGVPTCTEDPNRAKNKPRKKPPGEWAHPTIRQILGNETYPGTWYHGKRRREGGKLVNNPREQWIAVAVPAIINRETFDAAQAKLAENKAESKRNRHYEYLLAGRLTCVCGYKMHGRSKTFPDRGVTYLYYSCPAHSGNYPIACDSPLFRTDAVDTTVVDWLAGILTSPEKLAEALQNHRQEREQALAPIRRRLEVIDSLISKHTREMDNDLDLLTELDKRQAERARGTMLDKIERLEETLRGLEAQRLEALAQLRDDSPDHEQAGDGWKLRSWQTERSTPPI